jgi:mono/diheme cytochrome c family protein
LDDPWKCVNAIAVFGSWLCLLGVAFAALGGTAAAQETVPLDRLDHIHGLAVDPDKPTELYLATHHGLFRASPDGTATRIGASQDDLMSFSVHPTDPEVFYASGHPPGGGNLGFLTSGDRGRTWQPLSAGADGPVDFHAMAVSRADPRVIYGLYKGLQVSENAGRTWRVAGPLPKEIFDLAASVQAARRLYAATRGGLMASPDGGGSWTPLDQGGRPVTLVHVADGGRIYVYVYGVGLVAGMEPGRDWELRSGAFGDRFLLHLAVDPDDPERLHAVADTGAVMTSRDGGRTWGSYLGHDRETPAVVARAGRLYNEVCASCHGDKGVGERPDDMYAVDAYGFVAPPLDDSSHGWHHSDSNLAETVLNGSPRNPRMMPFKELLSEEDALDLVAYVKSLWSPGKLACQGARHMRCPH